MLTGIHHVTAIAGDARQNLDFYTRVLGLRLVKRTVSYDDPATYHFYFGDREGRPGSLLTFFPWGHMRTPRKGSGQVVAVGFAVAPSALDVWAKRLSAEGISVAREERTVLFHDPDGLELELHADANAGEQLERLSTVTLLMRDKARAADILEGLMGVAHDSLSRYVLADGSRIHVRIDPNAELGTMGRGIVHHVAFRVGNDAIEDEWRQKLMAAGLRVSGVKDRTYFHSIYFRPQGCPLFEIATDGPGFTIDEPLETLGQALTLPHWLESHRESIVSRLPSLV